MKFEATAITLVGVASSLGAEAKNSGIFSTLKDVPDQVFRDVPSLQEKERESRARFVSQIGGAIHSRSLQQDDNTGSTNNDDSQWGSVQNRYGDFWNPDLAVKDFGFDINSYSLKVTGCHTVGGYDEDVAENKNYDTVLGTDSFVTFRLCETGSCQGDGGYSYGCTSNFGEYMVPLGQYVEAQTNYRYDRKEAFCQYCEYCAAMTGYKSWNTMMQGTLQGLATAAQDYFDDWFQQYYYDYRFGDEYVGDSGFDEDAFLADAKIVFWKAAQSQDNAYDDNYADQTAEASYFDIFQTYSQFWDYQKNPEFFQGNGNQQSQDWADMDGQYPKYCGRPILNGYFSETGDFEEAWGYFNATGDFVSFESGGGPMIWDEECHGTMPNGWEYVMGTDPEEFEECDDQYSKACSSSFLDCQFTLYFDDMDALYQQLVANAGNDGSSSQSQQIKNFESIYESEAAEHSFTQALNCQKVDYQNNDEQLQDSTYANQINFEQLYKQKKAYSEAAADCDKYENDDYDTCMYELQIKIDANLQYIQWIIKSAWDKYKTYQAMNAEYYVGAYCKSKDSIGLQVFADQNCMVPHPSASVSDVLGDVMDSGYNLVSSECIPCNNEQFHRPGQDDTGDNEDGEVLEFCSMLYQIAGKCNKNLKPAKIFNGQGFYQDGVYYESTYHLMYGSEQQEENEKRVCGMIESLNSGTYKEDGTIFLGRGWLAGHRLRNELASMSSGMSSGMKKFIFFLTVCCAALGFWASVLRGAVTRKSELFSQKDPTSLARQNSGIVVGRTRSGPASSPLI